MADKTAEEYRADAADKRNEAAKSFERCDTDGFVSQWAHGVNAALDDMKAKLAENGGKHSFPALFDLAGNLIAARLVDGKYGPVWGILPDDNPKQRFVGWFNPSGASTAEKRRANNARKGYYVGRVMAPAGADLGGSGTGLSGALTVRPYVYRRDGGFSRNVDIVDNGQ